MNKLVFGPRWTLEEDETLCRMWTVGKPRKAIAEAIGRSVGGVSCRVVALGLPPRHRQCEICHRRFLIAISGQTRCGRRECGDIVITNNVNYRAVSSERAFAEAMRGRRYDGTGV